MFVDAMKWREEKDIYNVISRVENSEYFDLLKNYWPISLCKEWDFWAYDNCYVSYQRSGLIDTSIMELIPMEDLIDYHCYCMEILERKYAKIYKKKGFVPGQIILEDMTGFGTAFLDKKIIEMVQHVAQIDSDYYPAILRKFYFFNAPGIFTVFWGVVKKFLDKETVMKFEVLGSNKEKNEEVFSKIVPSKYLLECLGGTCKYQMPSGGPVNEVLKSLPLSPNKARTIKVIRNSSYNHVIDVERDGILSWEFTSSEDMRLQIISENKTVVSKTRTNTRKTSIGSSDVKAGQYTLNFDNQSFWNDNLLQYKYSMDPK
eukprot:TRINITY_DN4010_c0_g1_i1.p1 TRINITY_DN4010_c0_g1~~TRINITY_DN4010_c0_g1_i1.p1  ORF type:complete len:316 (-),score=74.21 TRINITY_DN4010_c0_g1_i1:371-1318(-)